MDVFKLRNEVIGDYASYVRSFFTIRDQEIAKTVEANLKAGRLWPEPLIQLNPAFEPGPTTEALVEEGLLHPTCEQIFRRKPEDGLDKGPLRLHRHQGDGIHAARAGDNYVLTTGTGSGKSLAYIVPIVDHVLREGPRQGHPGDRRLPDERPGQQPGGRAGEVPLQRLSDGKPPVTFARYTGQEDDGAATADPRQPAGHPADQLRDARADPHPPDGARADRGCRGQLRFLVLDELHTYRGRQGADVAMLVRRVREAMRRAGAAVRRHLGDPRRRGDAGRAASARSPRSPRRLFGAEVSPSASSERPCDASRREGRGRPDALRCPASPPAATRQIRRPSRHDPLAAWVESTLGLRRHRGRRALACAHARRRSPAGTATPWRSWRRRPASSRRPAAPP